MATFIVEEDEILPEDTLFTGRLEGIEPREIEFTDKKTGEIRSFTKLTWRFTVTEGQYSGKTVRGETDTRLTANSVNPFFNWSCALLKRTIPVGTGIDPEDLIGLPCQFSVTHVLSKDKTRKFANVDCVLQAEDNSSVPF